MIRDLIWETAFMEDKQITEGLIDLTADIVSAYVSNNAVVSGDLPILINETFDALSKAAAKASLPLIKTNVFEVKFSI